MAPTIYTSGEWAIDRDNYGIYHGLSWGIWHRGELIITSRSLRGAKHAAKCEGQTGEWVKGHVQMVVVESSK